MTQQIIIHSDGGARGNPGPSAIGAVLTDGQGQVLQTISQTIGLATNNQAEYRAIIAALTAAQQLRADEIICYLDSELVVKQINGQYKVKNRELAELFLEVSNLRARLPKTVFKHVLRAKNVAADKLVNQALDQKSDI